MIEIDCKHCNSVRIVTCCCIMSNLSCWITFMTVCTYMSVREVKNRIRLIARGRNNNWSISSLLLFIQKHWSLRGCLQFHALHINSYDLFSPVFSSPNKVVRSHSFSIEFVVFFKVKNYFFIEKTSFQIIF